MTGDEEILQYKLVCLLSHLLKLVPVGKEISDAQRGPFRSIDQEATIFYKWWYFTNQNISSQLEIDKTKLSITDLSIKDIIISLRKIDEFFDKLLN